MYMVKDPQCHLKSICLFEGVFENTPWYFLDFAFIMECLVSESLYIFVDG